MATVPLFKNRKGNVAVIRKGMRFNFNSGRYFTTKQREIDLLKLLAEHGEQGVYIDPKEPDIDTEAATPMAVLRKKFYKEFLEEQAKVTDAGKYHAPTGQDIGAMNTASNVLQGNQLAEKVALEDADPSPKDASSASTKSPALAALEAMKEGKK
jgi:hypothetical protein